MASAASLRVIFFGTPDFALPTLRALSASQHRVVGVVSQPDRPRGRGRKLEATPVKLEALERGFPLLQPAKVGSPDACDWMQALAPDLGVVVAFGQFIPRPVRELPGSGLVNGHGSLLPRHRGAAPVQHAILAGDRVSGVTVIRVAREMDAGDWCLKRELEIGPAETSGQLSARIAELAADALVEAVDRIAAGSAEFRPQDEAGVTQAPKLGRDFGRLDWSEPRELLLRRIRAATPWPGADVGLRLAKRRFRILEAAPAEAQAASAGRVNAAEGRLRISGVDGWIEVRRLQAPGRRPVTAAEFLRGARIPEDEQVEPG